MKILIINCGSSSFKYSLFEMNNGHAESIFSGVYHNVGDKIVNHAQAAEKAIQALTDPDAGILSSLDEITAVGHRVVHGGEKFVAPAIINAAVLDAIKEYAVLAPLHNPINLEGIKAVQSLLPDIPHVAVFDTAFHQSLAPEVFLYAIPYTYYQDYGIRRYGFHGSSHKYVFGEAASFLNKNSKTFKAIICHLGSGASITAVSGGKVMETSMGFTPLEGLIMGTRSGDLDPSIPFFIARQTGQSLDEIEDILNKKSGILGISGCSNDMRTVLESADNNDMRCQYAVKAYVHRVIKYIGAYVSVLNGVDAIVFTAGIGENSPVIRKTIMDRLSWLGIEIDAALNKKTLCQKAMISQKDSTVKVLVIPTAEELEIANQTFQKIAIRKLKE